MIRECFQFLFPCRICWCFLLFCVKTNVEYFTMITKLHDSKFGIVFDIIHSAVKSLHTEFITVTFSIFDCAISNTMTNLLSCKFSGVLVQCPVRLWCIALAHNVIKTKKNLRRWNTIIINLLDRHHIFERRNERCNLRSQRRYCFECVKSA